VYVVLTDDEAPSSRDESFGSPTDQSELVAVLREQLAAERQAHAEARRIIAGLVERIPQLEAPSEPRESPETASEEPERAEPRPGTSEAQEGAQRPWWRRWFGA
jgi:hypothetical protein